MAEQQQKQRPKPKKDQADPIPIGKDKQIAAAKRAAERKKRRSS